MVFFYVWVGLKEILIRNPCFYLDSKGFLLYMFEHHPILRFFDVYRLDPKLKEISVRNIEFGDLHDFFDNSMCAVELNMEKNHNETRRKTK